MATTTLNTKIKLRYDTLANWQDLTVTGKGGNLVLLKGEVAFCEVPAATLANNTIDANGASTVNGVTTNNMPTIIFKVGDGVHAFKDLNWGSALAADVYAWAKAATKPSYNAKEIGIADDNDNITPTTVEGAIIDLYSTISAITGGASSSIADQIAAQIAALTPDATGAAQNSGVTVENGKYITGLKVDTNGVLTLTTTNLPDWTSTINTAISTALGALDFADGSATTGTTMSSGDTVVTSVTQTDGQIAVTKQSLGLGTAARADVSNSGIVDGADATGENTYNGDLVTAAQVATYVKNRTAALTGATHFKGALTVGQDETAADVLAAISNPAAGDIYLVGTAEYIYNDDADNSGANAGWVLLGDEGIYATQAALTDGLAGKVDKVTDHSLLADSEITRLAGIASGAQVNVIEGISIDGTAVTLNNKVADLGKLAGEDEITYSDLATALAQDIDGKLDGVSAGIATVDNNDIVTIKGGLTVDSTTVTGTNTVVNTASTNDITLAKVAKTGLITDLDLGDGLILDGGDAGIPAQSGN